MEPSPATQLIEAIARGIPPFPRTLIVAAHPDDETAGVGSRLGRFSELTIVHITDGSPLDLRDARANGFTGREQYAKARREELEAALRYSGVGRRLQMLMLGLVDQRASFHLVELTGLIADCIRSFRPDLVLTHPYEGGHPDHDSCAFAVNRGVRMTGVGSVGEFASYHAGANGVIASDFLPRPEPVFTVELTAEERALKEHMMDSFQTQRATLAIFSREVERYRPAPVYEFRLPPHAGHLFYENFDWGMTGSRFCDLAQRALEELRYESPLCALQS
jgi:LmbE family N-acetylglucosaminyl deacetylase